MLDQSFFNIATRKETFGAGHYHKLDPRKILDLRFPKQFQQQFSLAESIWILQIV